MSPLCQTRVAVYDVPRSGAVAEWLRSGLQSRVHRFDSGRRLWSDACKPRERRRQVAPRTMRRMTAITPASAAAPAEFLKPWGLMAVVALHGCSRERLADPETIRRFVPAVIEAIGMRAHGPLMIERFGQGDLEGWSAMQFIETSSITIHADEFSGRCYVDVFSCMAFDPELAARIAADHFGGTPTVTVLHR